MNNLISLLFQITKLKIDSNPFAKGFRDSSRLTEFERYPLTLFFILSLNISLYLMICKYLMVALKYEYNNIKLWPNTNVFFAMLELLLRYNFANDSLPSRM